MSKKQTVANRRAVNSSRVLADPHPVLLAFGDLLRRKRVAKQLSMNQLCRITGVHSSHACYVQQGRVRIAPAIMRVMAGILGITDIEAWIIACWGLEGPISFADAIKVAEVLQVKAQPIDVSPYVKKLKPKLRCARCGHEWRKKTSARPSCCPHCRTKHYDVEVWTEKHERAYQHAKKSSTAFWAGVGGAAARRKVSAKRMEARTGKHQEHTHV